MTLYMSEVISRDAWWAPFASCATVLLCQYFSYWSLLCPPRTGWIIRHWLLVISLPFWYDISFNPRISFGSRLRDTALGILSWTLMSKSLIIGLVFDRKGTAAPHWIVPDWSKESQADEIVLENESKDQDVMIQQGYGKAKRREAIPLAWRRIEHPSAIGDQAIWAFDVWMYRRPCTSLLFANELRALEWSKSKLERAAVEQRRRNRRGIDYEQNFAVESYGRLDVGLFGMAADFLILIVSYRYLTSQHVPGTSHADYWNLPTLHRLKITSAMGCCIATYLSTIDYIVLPLLRSWPFCLPATAIVPLFRDVGRSKSLTSMWSQRWHTMFKRDFIDLSSLIPIGRSSSRTANVLKVFFWSGIMHSMAFIHLAPETSYEVLFSLPKSLASSGTMTFFMLQGLLVIFEQLFASLFSRRIGEFAQSSKAKEHLVEWLKLLWVWTSMTSTGQFLAADVISWNLLTVEQIRTMSFMALSQDLISFLKNNLVATFQ